MKIKVEKEVLFDLLRSHSDLSQAEYNRNPAYNNAHPSYVAEQAMIEELDNSGHLAELMVERL